MKTFKRLDRIARGVGMSRQQMIDIFDSMECGESVIVGDKKICKMMMTTTTTPKLHGRNGNVLRVMQDGKIISSVMMR